MSPGSDVARPLRVLLVTPDFPPAHGGIQRLLYEITSHMPSAEVRVVTLSTEGAAEFDRSSRTPTRRLPAVGRRPLVRNAMLNVSLAFFRSSWRPDVILNGHVVTAPAAVVLARRFKVRQVLYTYGKEVEGRPRTARWAMRRAHAGVTVAAYTRGAMERVAGGLLPLEVRVVHPGTKPPSELPSTRAQRPTVLTTARLRDWYKGHDVMVHAMEKVVRRVPDARWVVIGDGRLRPELEQRCADRGLAEAVTFLGSVDDATRDHWLGQAHVFAMPARYPEGEVGGEGFPVVYLEAAAWGLPTLAGNVGGPAEAVLDRQTGLLVNPESADEVADALSALLLDPSLAATYGVAARNRVLEEFTWESVAAQLESLLRDVAGVEE